MTQLHAFVGHSFTKDDSAIVDQFLRYFNQLKEVHPSFSWHHAEHAEPTVVTDKVLRLLEGKNIFIGICTKKELVVQQSALKRPFFSNKKFQANEEDFYWKTSDWIIQEIGLAIGLKLNVVLFLEQGVRAPGALQGNLEYIQFERNAPEKSFGKFLEMISALSPKTDLIAAHEPETKSMQNEVKEARPNNEENWSKIQPDWERSDFEWAYMHFIAKDNFDSASNISAEYMASKLAELEPEKKSWEAFKEYIRLQLGSGGDFNRLRTLADENTNNTDVLQYLAKVYEKYDEYEKAALTFEQAAKTSTNIVEETKIMGNAAFSYQKANDPKRAFAIMDNVRAKAHGVIGCERALLMSEIKIAKANKDDQVLICSMERLLELDPTDKDTRFSLAYKYSELGDDDMAVLHYSLISEHERSPIVWNNLGASLDQLDLQAKSVVAYRKSEELGETLPMSNLANKFIKSGFLPEAQKICEAALSISEYHKNILSTLGRLKEIPDEEEKSLEITLRKATPKSDFYKKLGMAIANPFPKNFPSIWQGKRCKLELVLTDSKFSLSGTYEELPAGLGLLNSIMGGSEGYANKSESIPIHYLIIYTGVVRGCSLSGTVSRTRISEPPKSSTLLGAANNDRSVVMFLTADQSEIQVFEKTDSGNPQFYSFEQITNNQ